MKFHGRIAATFCTVIIALILANSCATNKPEPKQHIAFQPSSMCRGCHTTIAEQHAGSMHAASYTNPVFQAQFNMEYLKQFHEEIGDFRQEPPCLACHAPMAYIESGYNQAKKQSMVFDDGTACQQCHLEEGDTSPEALEILRSGVEPHEASATWRMTYVNPEARDLAISGVGCDLCHTMTSVERDPIGNARFQTSPGPTKYGPFEHERDWHHAYGELQTTSEICAACHEASNRHGVPIRTTYSEWKTSPQAQNGIQCQDCHMTVNGFLDEDGNAEYESGVAAHMTLGPEYHREKLYTHRFVGAANHSQIEGAVTLDFNISRKNVRPGELFRIVVLVNNSRTGHRFPTGSPELRSIHLDLFAEIDGQTVHAFVVDKDEESLGILGANDFDYETFGEDLNYGARIYRSVFLDAEGFETLSFYNATDLAFDNRLHAGEVREEIFELEIPDDLSGEITLKAVASYLRYPPAFSQRLGQEESQPVEIASTSTILSP